MPSIDDAVAPVEHEFKCSGCGEMQKTTYGVLRSKGGYQCQCGQATRMTDPVDSATGERMTNDPVQDLADRAKEIMKNFGK